MTCGPCQDLLLDHLYGLLDPAETEALRSHLDDCPECRAALLRVTQEKTRIAQAARAISDVPEFRAPDSRPAEPPPSPAPLAETPVPRRGGYRPLAWVLASAAAACALVVGVLGYRHNERVGLQTAQIADVSRTVTKVDARIASLKDDTLRKLAELPETLGRHVVQVTVAGSNRIVPGVTAPVEIALNTVDGQPSKGEVDVQVTDAKGTPIARRRLAVDGSATISGAELAANHVGPAKLEVRYADADGTPAVIDEALRCAPQAYAAHLSVNKQLFRPGEAVLVRALFVDRWTLKAPDGPLQASVSLTDGVNAIVTQPLAFVKGMAAARLTLPPTLPPSVYTVRLNAEELAPTSRTIEVLAPDQPTVDVFAQAKAYRGGEQAQLALQFNLPNGKPAANSAVEGNYSVNNTFTNNAFANNANGINEQQGRNGNDQRGGDPGQNNNFRANQQGVGGFGNGINNGINNGNNYNFGGPISGRTDKDGKMVVPVPLPKELVTNSLQVNVDAKLGKKQQVEASASLRVVPSKLEVEFHPEGGRLIAGVTNRVYYRVRTPLGETAAPEGRVILLSSNAVIHDSDRDESAGFFDFVPDRKEKYQLRITGPMKGQIDDPFAGLDFETEGVVIDGMSVQAGDRPIELRIRNVGRARLLQVLTTCRDEIVEHQRYRQETVVPVVSPNAVIDVPARDPANPFDDLIDREQAQPLTEEALPSPERADVGERQIKVASALDGIHRVSVFEVEDGKMTLLAERLLYREPTRHLDLSATLARKAGNRVELHVAGTNEAKQPTDFYCLGSVVDDRFLNDRPEPTLTEQFLVLGDPNANFVDQPLLARPAGLDLALGILGWRAAPLPQTALAKADAKEADAMKADGARPQDERLRAGLGLAKKEGAALFDEANRDGEGTTFFTRVEPTPAEVRRRLASVAVTARLDLEQRASKARQALVDERAEMLQQRAALEAELRGLEEQPHQMAMMALGGSTFAALVVGTIALLWGFARLLMRRGSSSTAFGVAFVGIAACLLLLLFQPNDVAVPEQFAMAKKEPVREPAPAQDDANFSEAQKRRQAAAKDARVAVNGPRTVERAEGLAVGAAVPAPLGNVAGAGPGGLGGGGGRAAGEQQFALREQAALARPAARRDSSSTVNRSGAMQMRLEKDSDPADGAPAAARGAFAGGGLPPGRASADSGESDKAKGPAAPPGAVPAVARPTAPGVAPPAPVPAAAPAPQPTAAMKSALSPKDRAADSPAEPAAETEMLDRLMQSAGKGSAVDLGRARAEFGMKHSPDTLLWSPALQVPPGGATLPFDVPAGTARYRILILGHTDDGRFGGFEDHLLVTPNSRPVP
jgi:Putative zinc-finger